MAKVEIKTVIISKSDFAGNNYKWIVVVYNGHVLGVFPRDQALKAFVCQFGAIYNFGVNIDTGKDGKRLTGNGDYFNVVTRVVCGINTKEVTGPQGRQKVTLKRMGAGAQKLLKLVYPKK